MVLRSILVAFACLLFSGLSHADDKKEKFKDGQIWCKNGRCVNDETRAFFGFTFTPSYKSIYAVDAFDDLEADCDNPPNNPKQLPRSTYFRETLHREAQGSNEIVVHVYEVNQVEAETPAARLQATDEEYFRTPLKVCLNETTKSFYKRVGGVSTGLLVVPFKLRSGDIYSDTSIGPYLSYKWEVIELLGTAGLSQVSISEVGSADVETRSGLTVAVGINFAIDTNWDVALLVGRDRISGQAGRDWEFQNKNWVSFAIGFNFTR